MKMYFIVRGEYANQYRLFWTTLNGLYPDKPECFRHFNVREFLEEYPNAERITREQAIAFARAERRRRRENGYFSGYASTHIEPYGVGWYDPAYAYLHCDSTGVIVI